MATANASVVLVISTVHGKPSQLVGSATAPHESVLAITKLLESAAGGNEHVSVDAYSSTAAPVAATATATLASVLDGDTIVIGGTTLTAKTSPVGQAQYLRGVSNNADAAALAACINAHTTLSPVVSAKAVTNVVTITAQEKGTLSNFVTLTSAATITLSGATMTGGTGGMAGAAATYRFGL